MSTRQRSDRGRRFICASDFRLGRSTALAVWLLASVPPPAAGGWRQEIQSGSSFSYGAAASVAVDARSDVIAAGISSGSYYYSGFTVIKFDGATGTRVWGRYIHGSVGDFCLSDFADASFVTVDSNRDVIAAGEVPQCDYSNFTVIKFDGATGVELWDSRINGGVPILLGGSDRAWFVTADGNGDVIAAGYLVRFDGSPYATFQDPTVVKLDGATGAELWRIEGVGGDVAVDSNGDVVIAGSNVIRFDGATGAELWRIEGVGGDVAVDSNGDVVIAGSNVIKFDGATGAELWRQQIDGISSGDDVVLSVAVDAGGGVIAGGYVDNVKRRSFLVIKFNGEDGRTAGLLGGKRLLVKDNARNPSKRRIVVVAKDGAVLTPAAGSPDDPTVAGAKLLLLNQAATESATFAIPGGSLFWKGLGDPPGSKGYRYRDPGGSNSPCKVLVAKPGRLLKAKCVGRLGTIPFSLDEATQGSLTVSIRLGNAEAQCVTFGGKIRRDEGTRNPGPRGIFLASDAPPSGRCLIP